MRPWKPRPVPCLLGAALGAAVVLAVLTLGSGRAPSGPAVAGTPPAVSLQPHPAAGTGTSPPPGRSGAPSGPAQPAAGQQPVLAANVRPQSSVQAPQPSRASGSPHSSRPVPTATATASPSPSPAAAPTPSPSCLIGVRLPVADVCADLTIGG